MTVRGSARPAGTRGVDLRTAEGRLMARTRQRLTQHVGTPNLTQKALIERGVMLTAHLARLDAVALRTGQLDTRSYLTLNVALSRILLTLERLGTKARGTSPESKPDTLADIVSRLSA